MKKKFFIGLFIFAAIGLFIFAHIVLKQNNSEYQPQQNINAPIEIPGDSIIHYEDAIKIDKPIVALFYVDWCGYCRKFMPVFGEIAKKYTDKYTFAAINCDNPQYSDVIKEFHIMGFPSLFIIDNKINHKFSMNIAGTVDKKVMQEELDNYFKIHEKLSNLN